MRLGARQQKVYDIMTGRDRRYPAKPGWSQDAGWNWGSDSETDTICRSLVRRGLLRLVRVESSGYGVYELIEGPS